MTTTTKRVPETRRVLLVRCKYGPRVVPGAVVVRIKDTIEFVAVDGGPYNVKINIEEFSFSTKVDPNMSPWPSVTLTKVPLGCYTYEVFDAGSKFHAAGNSAPVIIIEPD